MSYDPSDHQLDDLDDGSATYSVAELADAINGAIGAHFGDGVLRGADLAAGMVGAIVKDPLQDRVAMLEYLETVVKEREEIGRAHV